MKKLKINGTYRCYLTHFPPLSPKKYKRNYPEKNSCVFPKNKVLYLRMTADQDVQSSGFIFDWS